MMMKHFALFLFVATSLTLNAQDQIIQLTNASFEGFPRESMVPRAWYDCGFPNESPPDVHPRIGGGEFNVSNAPQDQNTYLGLVVRDNDTWESISQRLTVPLKGGKCYAFSIYVARSLVYESQSRVTNERANYATPARLRIWGGNGYCDKTELLGETKEVINTRWLERIFKFEPKTDIYYITLEAFYKTPVLFPYNGNILLDNASNIRLMPCDDDVEEFWEAPIADDDVTTEPAIAASTPTPTPVEEPETQLPPDVQVEDRVATTPTPAIKTVPQPRPERTIGGKRKEELREGEIIRMDKLFFEVDKAEIESTSFEVLDEVYEFLDAYEKVTVEIGGHTNGMCDAVFCDSLSTMRARAVANYLSAKGIDMERLQYKGYGKRQPVATNRTPTGRRKNQRVEIKILSFG